MEKLLVKLNLYNENIRIELPDKYNDFRKYLCNILQITLEDLKNIKISYKDLINKEYIISNSQNYDVFLALVARQETKELNIEFTNDKIKNENIIENNNKIEKERLKNINFNEFNIKCDFCKNNSHKIIYYCKECEIFFCSNCESDKGLNHPHCYFKIRNKDQLKELNNYYNTDSKNANNLNNNNANNNINNINDNLNSISNKIGEALYQGTNMVGNAMNGVKNLLEFKESLNVSNLLNKGLKYINDNYNPNNRNNNINTFHNINH